MGNKLLLLLSILVPLVLSSVLAWQWWDKDDPVFLGSSIALLSVALMGCVVFARSQSKNNNLS